MLKKISCLFTISISLIFFLCFDYIYYPLMGFKASSLAKEYIEAKYGEEIVIDDVSYSKAIGDSTGKYFIHAHSKNNPEIEFDIYDTQHLTSISDNYKEQKWTWQLEKEWNEWLHVLYPTPFVSSVSASFPSEAKEIYSAKDSYQKVLSEKYAFITNDIVLHIFDEPTTHIESELERIYWLIMKLKSQHLKDFSLKIYYYSKDFSFQLNNRYIASSSDAGIELINNSTYIFHFDTRMSTTNDKLLSIQSSIELKEFIEKRDDTKE
ncbi:hypothetical protein LCL95_16875 [Bacillus timonensis]|nr:hypothetical protein [Bacillus timonensis]